MKRVLLFGLICLSLTFAAERKRLKEAYARAYSSYFADTMPDNGVPARFIVHLIDFPDEAASYEFYSVGLLQKKR